MEMDKDVLSRIKGVLKNNPRGMSVIEIAGEIRRNRQSVAKYMEMLVMSGHVDVHNFGASKVYYLTQRLPISALLNLTSGFIIILDGNLNVINVNDHFLEFVNIEREDLMYKGFEKFAFPIEFKPSIIPNIKDAVNGTESTIEALYAKKDNLLYFKIKFIPMVLEDGDPGVTIFFDDVTDRRRIEEAHSQLAAIVEASSDAIISETPDGAITSWNKGAERIYGYKADDIIGKPISILVPEGYPDDIPLILKKIRQGENIIYHKAKRVRKDGKLIDVSLTVSPIKDLTGRVVGVATISREITEFKPQDG
jgi:PAS domain S-box-containing protein